MSHLTPLLLVYEYIVPKNYAWAAIFTQLCNSKSH